MACCRGARDAHAGVMIAWGTCDFSKRTSRDLAQWPTGIVLGGRKRAGASVAVAEYVTGGHSFRPRPGSEAKHSRQGRGVSFVRGR